jgi:hypothetical protein
MRNALKTYNFHQFKYFQRPQPESCSTTGPPIPVRRESEEQSKMASTVPLLDPTTLIKLYKCGAATWYNNPEVCKFASDLSSDYYQHLQRCHVGWNKSTYLRKSSPFLLPVYVLLFFFCNSFYREESGCQKISQMYLLWPCKCRCRKVGAASLQCAHNLPVPVSLLRIPRFPASLFKMASSKNLLYLQ